MRSVSKPAVLTAITFSCGLACLCARQWLISGTDEKGLLPADHPGDILAWVLLAAVAGFVYLAFRGKQDYRIAPTPLSAVGCFFGAVGFASVVLPLLRAGNPAALAAALFACVSCLLSLFQGVLRLRKQRMHPLLLCGSVVFFMLFLLYRYQQWSSESELQHYFFQLTACICLTLTTYHRADLVEAKSDGRFYLLFSRASIFLCLAAVPGSPFGVLYGTMAVSLLLDGCAIYNAPEPVQESEVPAQTPEQPQ